MNTKNLYNTIVEYCSKNQNPANVIKYSKYFRSGYDAWGLSQKQITDFTKELLKNPKVNLQLTFETMPLLMESGKYEETSIGLLLVNGMNTQFSDQTLSEISKLFSFGISNWAHADTLGMWILPTIIKMKLTTEDDMIPWVKSANSFQRRCVPVTFIKSLKKIDSPKHLFAIINPLMNDRAREVQQGTGWFLRESWKMFPTETELFLNRHKNTSPRLIFQYACEKMLKSDRINFRKQIQ